MRVLFITKKNNNSYGISLGLVNSASFVVRELNKVGIYAKLVSVHDNNGIDHEVHHYKPDVVIIEALWVVPEKFDVLKAKYPNIKWVIRLHSKIPFLSQEGMAVDWIKRCLLKGVFVAVNHVEILNSLNAVLDQNLDFLPNVYNIKEYHKPKKILHDSSELHISSFGAIRPLKNTLQQAVAAMKYANMTDRQLFFHINAGRLERGGESVFRNLVSLFEGTQHILVHHGWYTHEEFVKRLDQIDIGMQVSYSESFNIVTADLVAHSVPVVVSPDIDWVSGLFRADPNSVEDIINKLENAEFFGRFGTWLNKVKLERRSRNNFRYWIEFLECVN